MGWRRHHGCCRRRCCGCHVGIVVESVVGRATATAATLLLSNVPSLDEICCIVFIIVAIMARTAAASNGADGGGTASSLAAVVLLRVAPPLLVRVTVSVPSEDAGAGAERVLPGVTGCLGDAVCDRSTLLLLVGLSSTRCALGLDTIVVIV